MALAGEPREALDHHASSGKVDPHRQCLGGEDDADKALSEEFLCDLLEQRKHPCVVGCDTAFKALTPYGHAQDSQVLLGKSGHPIVDDLCDLCRLGLVGQADPVPDQFVARLFTSGPAEDEVDGRQQVAALQFPQHLVTSRGPPPAGRTALSPGTPAVPRSPGLGVIPAPLPVGSALDQYR